MAEVVTEIAQKVKEIIAEQLGIEPETLTAETFLTKDLNVDSLDTVEIAMSLEDVFCINIPDEDVEKVTTVGEIIEYVKKRKENF